MRKDPVVWIVVGGTLLFVLLGVLLVAAFIANHKVAPSPEKVIKNFQSSGLEVGSYHDLDEDAEFQQSITPKSYAKGYWFEIPSLFNTFGEPAGGKVYTFRSRDDLEEMLNYYGRVNDMPIFGNAVASDVYVDERRRMLLQMPAEVPDEQVHEYYEAMQETTWLPLPLVPDPYDGKALMGTEG